MLAILVTAAGCSTSHHRSTRKIARQATTTSTTAAPRRRPAPDAAAPASFREVPRGALPSAVQLPAAAGFTEGIRYAGGLDAQSSSTAQIVSLTNATARPIGQLPSARHDAAGAAIGNALYVFGGGTSSGQLNSILRVDSAGHATTVGTLPAASSDSSATAVGDTAYVVGGYDGAHWLDTIVAFTPTSGAHVVAHLPTGVRYAAVAAVDGRVLVAGGTTPTQSASTAVYAFDPRTTAVTKVGDLPVALSHAAAVGLNNEILVVGGRMASGTSDAITAVNAANGRTRAAGHLDAPRSDEALVRDGAHFWLFGGRNDGQALESLSELVRSTTTDPSNVYAHDTSSDLNAVAKTARSLIYVPNSQSNTVDVIDPATMKIVDHFAVGELPQHVTPAWDMKTLYVDNDLGNSLTPIDPTTGKPSGPAIPVTDPYNLYFTPDGHFAIVVAERFNRLDFRDPHTMALRTSVPVPCRGIDHMDFTADGSIALASCEFSGTLVVIDVKHPAVVRTISLGRTPAKPQDVKLSPDGNVFYVADMDAGGVWKIDAHSFSITGFVATGRGAHGLYPSRDATKLYVTNRNAGTISILDFATGRVVGQWTIPGGSPDMGGVSADGSVLWLSGRYNAEVYAISTSDGHLLARIPVGRGPHGLSVWPQPGRYSLGHTGIMR